MTTSLRVRLLAIVLAAALVPIAPLAIVLLLQVRDAIYARRVADARARISAASAAARETCGEQRGCFENIARAAGGRVVPAPCASRMSRLGEDLVLCEESAPGLAIELRESLGPVREQLAVLDARLLVTLLLFVALLVGVAVWLLERGVVRRLAQVDAALEPTARSAPPARICSAASASPASAAWPREWRTRWAIPSPRSSPTPR